MSGRGKKRSKPEELYMRVDRTNRGPIVVEPEPEAWTRRSSYKIPKLEGTSLLPEDGNLANDPVNQTNTSEPEGLGYGEPSLADCESSAVSSQGDNFNDYQLKYDEHGLFPMPDSCPKELREMCKVGSCQLCSIELSSVRIATLHYSGKPHAKRERSWGIEKKSELRGLEQLPLYCKYCDVNLSSAMAAADHYRGKKHKAVIEKGLANGVLNNDTGLMERSETAKQDKTGRFGIGLKFDGLRGAQTSGHMFSCIPCNVHSPTQAALDQHLKGAKHRKKCPDEPLVDEVACSDDESALPLAFGSTKRSNNAPPEKVLKVPPSELEKRELLERVLMVDLQCHDCDVTFNDVIEMISHYKSKEHVQLLELRKLFDCNLCHLTLTGSTSMYNHMKNHVETLKNQENILKSKLSYYTPQNPLSDW